MNVTTVLDTLVIFLWLIFIGLLVLAMVRAARGRPVKNIWMVLLATAASAVVLSIISAGLVFIRPEERGVVISAIAPNGYREQPLQPGLNWIIPFFETVKTYPISRQTYTMSIAQSEGAVVGDDSISARTADGQEIFIDASVIYAIDPNQVIKVHIEWQDRYQDGLVRPLARGVIRDAVSQFGVEEVYSTKREELKQNIAQTLNEKFNENGLFLVEFVLRNITFSPEYAASVEQKQIAEQQAQQARFVVEQRRQEAEQARQIAQGQADAAVIRAKGEAEARLIQAQAEAQALEYYAKILGDPEKALQYLFIVRLAPGVQTFFLPGNLTPLIPFLLSTPTAMGSAFPEGLPTVPPLPTPQPTPTP